MTTDSTMAQSTGGDVGDAYRSLRAAILRGEIAAGETITQAALADRLEVGRTPLREALRTLQRERLIDAQPNRRVRIAALTAADAEQLYAMRIALEGVAVRATVPLLESMAFAHLEGFMAQMDHYARERDPWGFREPHMAFHALLVSAAGARMTEEIALLSDHAERYRARFGGADAENWERRRAEHREILDAAIARDAERCAGALTRHYAQTAEAILSALAPDAPRELVDVAVAVIAPGGGAVR